MIFLSFKHFNNFHWCLSAGRKKLETAHIVFVYRYAKLQHRTVLMIFPLFSSHHCSEPEICLLEGMER